MTAGSVSAITPPSAPCEALLSGAMLGCSPAPIAVASAPQPCTEAEEADLVVGQTVQRVVRSRAAPLAPEAPGRPLAKTRGSREPPATFIRHNVLAGSVLPLLGSQSLCPCLN